MQMHHLARQVPSSRALSTRTFVPRAMLKLVRLPLAGLVTAGGAYAYVDHKLDGFKTKVKGLFNSAGETASDLFDSVSGFSSDVAQSAQSGFRSLMQRLNDIQSSSYWSSREDSEDEHEDGQGSGGNGNGGKGLAAAAAAAVAAAVSGDGEQGEGGEQPPSPENSDELMLLTRKLIEVRNILKTIDHDSEELILPSIVVIGSQSSGKSSVLETIVGHEFLPKGNNMVTRRPIELTLVHVPKDHQPADGIVEYGEFPGTGMGKITDFSRIQKMLYDMNMAVPKEECVSETPIELHIHSPHVPDLSMIDLPGYVQLSSMDQPEELREKISGLCDKYIKEPNIILAVCAADVDLANSPALRASRKVDPMGVRTIGVITKMDLVAPEVGAAILNNNKYPLSLGYVGVVCKAPHQVGQSMFALSRSNSLIQLTQEYERRFFEEHREHFAAPTRGRHAGQAPMVGSDQLRQRLMVVLEEHMGSSLSGVANLVRSELDDAAYQFKVQYNDRAITPETYVAEVMDIMKQRFKHFSSSFGKPEVRFLLKQALDDKVMDILAQAYWTDDQVRELTALGRQGKLKPEDLDAMWNHKLDMCSSSLTKSGIGRMSTQLVANTIRTQLEQLATAEPFNHHHETAERIIAFGSALLRDRFGITADQVENCVKPYKYEVEMDQREWEQGRQQSVLLMQNELAMCTEAYDRLKNLVGGRRLRGAMEYITQLEERERKRIAERVELAEERPTDLEVEDQNDPTRPGFNSALLMKAREARFLQDRADILRMRLAALRSWRCKAGPQSQAFCPETFLNVVADKLTYTAVMFINIELLAEFFYQFPREIDARLGYDMTHEDMVNFARENPAIRNHIDLQERKTKLEEVMLKLDDLTRLYHDRHPAKSTSKWLFF
ncbi:mgm1-mitochondrial gtpase dynamin [Malassezia pachydermatis]|uniref:dynamin GTPase n=1 Tax=Malassezia pachydermatis TaxID=77020 RepID=A0A0M8MJ60_9BASI|nr:mgm1-mitochondrial gtpase dynamin [Malassezia pachydermatis]KOS12598.1 mgm1-mitochondrial gtpase dynamin [Malassezia pachydermatis]